MKKKNVRFLQLIPFLLCLLAALGTAFVFTACGPKEDGSWMRCHQAQFCAVLSESILSVLLLIAAFMGGSIPGAVLYALGCAGSVILFLIPGILCPLCMMRTMDCFRLMQPFVRVMSAAVFLSSAFCAYRTLSDCRHRSNP